MNAHTADPFARDQAIREHLDAAHRMLSEKDACQNALRDLIVHIRDAEDAMGERDPDWAEISIAADWIEKTAQELTQHLHEVAEQYRHPE